MPPRAGLCVFLSFLIVALAAIGLNRSQHAPKTALPGPPARRHGSAAAPEVPQALPRPTPGQAWNGPDPVPTEPTRRPEGAFAEVRAGESLEDVANRLYGTPAWVQKLWYDNRDQLDTPRSPLHAGQMLRLP